MRTKKVDINIKGCMLCQPTELVGSFSPTHDHRADLKSVTGTSSLHACPRIVRFGTSQSPKFLVVSCFSHVYQLYKSSAFKALWSPTLVPRELANYLEIFSLSILGGSTISMADAGVFSEQSSDAVNLASPTFRSDARSVNSKHSREADAEHLKSSFTRTPNSDGIGVFSIQLLPIIRT